MRRILIAPLLVLALAVSGCAQFEKAVQVVTTTVTNPVDAVDIYRIKNGYAAALQASVDWRRFCWSKPYKDLMADPIAKPVCKSRRPWLRNIQLAKAKASSAVVSATVFVRDNPTLNASVALTAAWSAVKSFQNAVPSR